MDNKLKNKLDKISTKEQEAINILNNLKSEYKDNILPGLDILPNKRKQHSAFKHIVEKQTSNEFYKYKID